MSKPEHSKIQIPVCRYYTTLLLLFFLLFPSQQYSQGIGNNIHYTSMWNFIVIISPFTISIKKVRLLLYIFPEFFFAIKIHSFHAALNSDAPRLEFVLYMGNELGEVRIPFCSLLKSISYDEKKSSRFLKKKKLELIIQHHLPRSIS